MLVPVKVMAVSEGAVDATEGVCIKEGGSGTVGTSLERCEAVGAADRDGAQDE